MSETEISLVPPKHRFRLKLRHLALGAILLVALFLRLWKLGELPPGLAHDEAYNGLDALALLNFDTFPIFHEGWELYANEVHGDQPIRLTNIPVFLEGNYGREPITAYFMALAIYLFGEESLAIRIVPALFGVLAVFSTYLVASAIFKPDRESLNRKYSTHSYVLWGILPLLAAFTMAILYPALSFSRYGDRVMTFVPFETLTVYFFWRGITASEEHAQASKDLAENQPFRIGVFKPKWFVLAGVFLGFSLYTYAAARFLPLVFILFVAYLLWREPGSFPRNWANYALMVFTTLIIALPLAIFMVQNSYYLIYRSRYIANRGAGTYPGRPWLTWLFNLPKVGLGLFVRGDENISHNLPGRAFLDPIQAIFTALGILGIILRRFLTRDIFLLLWLIIMLLPSILSGDAPHFGRMIGASPPLAILIAFGAVWLTQIIVRQLEQTSDRIFVFAGLGLMILFLISAMLTVRDYFDRYATLPDISDAFLETDWQLGKYASTLPEDATIYLTPNQEQMATLYFALAGQKERLRSFHSPLETLIPAGYPGKAAIFLVRNYAQPVLQRLIHLFPNGAVDESATDFTAFWLPEVIQATEIDQQSEQSWGGAISLVEWSAERKNNILDVNLVWQAKIKMARDYTAYVHLLAQDGTLVSQLDRQPDGYPTSDWNPEELVLDKYQVPMPNDLNGGVYLLQTGFYHLPTGERLGEPLVLGEIEIN